jgi:glycosyltransferase involved in cell wall biosynthesis
VVEGAGTLRIVYAGHFLFPYGTASAARIRLLSSGLVSAGATVKVVLTLPFEPREADATGEGGYRYQGIDYQSIGLGREAKAPLAERIGLVLREQKQVRSRLAELLGEFGADVLVTYTSDAIEGAPMLGAARECGVRVVGDVVEWHNAFGWRGGWAHYRAISHAWQMRVQNWKADGIIGISSYLCRYYGRRDLPVLRLPTPSDVGSITPLPIEPHQGRSFRIGYFGTWSDKDGFVDMLEAVRLLRERNRPVELWAAGAPHSDRYMRRIRAFLQAHPGLKDSVKLLGRLPQQELPETFGRCDAMILSRPLKRFALAGLPQKVAEYMSLERPVIVTRVGDVPEYVRDGADGFVVPPDDAAAVARAVERLIELPDRGAAMGRSARLRAQEVFDFRMLGERMLRFLERVRELPRRG